MSAGQPVAKRIVSVEEHFLLPDLLRRIPEAAAKERGYFSRDQPYAGFQLYRSANRCRRAQAQGAGRSRRQPSSAFP